KSTPDRWRSDGCGARATSRATRRNKALDGGCTRRDNPQTMKFMNRLMSPTALLALALASSACGRSEAPATQTPLPAVEQTPPPPPAVGVYVTDESSGELSIIDAATQAVATIPLGK